jgi:uncharacterized protein DUF6570
VGICGWTGSYAWSSFELQSEDAKDERAWREIFICSQCFPRSNNSTSLICKGCKKSLESGKLSEDCSIINAYIGCEYRFPKKLDDLSPVEELLISLNTYFGCIARFTMRKESYNGVQYRKHLKGQILVFLNDVQQLSAMVFPNPIFKAMENIHESWTGTQKPTPQDVSRMLTVRKSVIIRALN